MDVEAVRSLYRYNRWVNELLLGLAERLPEAAARQTMGASFDTIHGTLAHLLGAEHVWFSRWRGETPAMLRGDAFADLAALRERWTAEWAAQGAFLAALTPERLEGRVAYTTTDGSRYEQPLWQMMLHCVNHATHHRGELCEMLTRAGTPPPPTDLIAFYRREG